MANLTMIVHPEIAARVAGARAAGVPDAVIAQYLGVTERELDRAYPRNKTPGLSGPGVGVLVLLIVIVALVASSSSSRR